MMNDLIAEPYSRWTNGSWRRL